MHKYKIVRWIWVDLPAVEFYGMWQNQNFVVENMDSCPCKNIFCGVSKLFTFPISSLTQMEEHLW